MYTKFVGSKLEKRKRKRTNYHSNADLLQQFCKQVSKYTPCFRVFKRWERQYVGKEGKTLVQWKHNLLLLQIKHSDRFINMFAPPPFSFLLFSTRCLSHLLETLNQGGKYNSMAYKLSYWLLLLEIKNKETKILLRREKSLKKTKIKEKDKHSFITKFPIPEKLFVSLLCIIQWQTNNNNIFCLVYNLWYSVAVYVTKLTR